MDKSNPQTLDELMVMTVDFAGFSPCLVFLMKTLQRSLQVPERGNSLSFTARP